MFIAKGFDRTKRKVTIHSSGRTSGSTREEEPTGTYVANKVVAETMRSDDERGERRGSFVVHRFLGTDAHASD